MQYNLFLRGDVTLETVHAKHHHGQHFHPLHNELSTVKRKVAKEQSEGVPWSSLITMPPYRMACALTIMRSMVKRPYPAPLWHANAPVSVCWQSFTRRPCPPLCKSVKVKTLMSNYYSFIQHILCSDYASGIWGLREHVICNSVRYRAMWWLLGVHKLTPVLAISGEIRSISKCQT